MLHKKLDFDNIDNNGSLTLEKDQETDREKDKK